MIKTFQSSSRVLAELARTGSTWNGALSYATTGVGHLSNCLDYWTKAGTYTLRDQDAVDADMGRIFADDATIALRVLFGLRLITRKPNVQGIDEVQTGYGRRDEFYKGIAWLHNNRPETLYDNLHLIPVFGSWKDILQAPLVDILDREKVYALVKANLSDQLLLKYLPQIRSKGKARTERDRKRIAWAKGLCKFLGISQKEYRALKNQGTAHIWQKQMQRSQWDDINFNGIPGKAMLFHTSRQGKDKKSVFERHGQIDRLKEWVLSQPTIKFNGYPYELVRAAKKNPSIVQRFIYDRQFEALLEPMRGHSLGNTLCCLDTSGSMDSEVLKGVSAVDICISMGIALSALNVGYFQDTAVAFDNTSRLIKLSGSFCDRVKHLVEMETAWGSTNFQSVIDLICSVRQSHPEIPINEYPETLLVISDMQFNPVGYDYVPTVTPKQAETNYEATVRKLKSVGLGDVRLIWWFVNGAGSDFPSRMDDKGVYMIGGFDPVNIKALMGLSSEKHKNKATKTAKDEPTSEEKETPIDGMLNFLGQPIFDLIK